MKTTDYSRHLLVAIGLALVLASAAWQTGYGIGFKFASMKSVAQISVPPEINFVAGEITDITDQTISLRAFTPGPSNRKIITNAKTVFERIVLKDQKAYQKELAAFQAKKQVTKASNTALLSENLPLPMTRAQILLDDLQKGDIIQANAAENILTKEQFIATKIVLQPRPPVDEQPARIFP